ncbi:hypothetical protein D8Y20_01460 [Mariprofundus sp. EBB-1]|uniref:hypothetical protein n=1 Tax=Mariprofundus sp. EBB-1 TaxID=2650971 RepID=UPI000EF20F56|nr:hypothetical protein [Mariprofundus sp. EBB-1]RLL55596.1 hypothetical protein D8Y20_01460 [Mariprofundus sp. EBB-1]
MNNGGFVDLRVNDESSEGESFWPAFTDIMTVIVIIFLLVMMTLLVKNMDLVNQLRASLSSERAAAAQAQSTSDTNTALNLRLRQLEEETSMLHMRLMDLGEEHNKTLTQLESSEQASQQLKQDLSTIRLAQEIAVNEKLRLQQTNTELEKNRSVLQRSVLALETTRSELEKKQAELTSQLEQRLQELLEQKNLSQLRVEEMDKLKVDRVLELERLKKLEKEYASLETRYNRLVRPARSQLGKVVTLVRYQKVDGNLSIEIQSPSDANYVPVSGIELHKRLAALQKKFGKKLYVRIIFPDDSGLSYTEAWNLTESLLRMYDYYYQE